MCRTICLFDYLYLCLVLCCKPYTVFHFMFVYELGKLLNYDMKAVESRAITAAICLINTLIYSFDHRLTDNVNNQGFLNESHESTVWW